MGKQSRKGDGECRSEDSRSATHLGCLPQPHCEPGWLKPPPGGEKVEKKTKSIQCTPPQPLLFCLLCGTNLECPAGTNYSILMSAVSNNCIWRACYRLIHMLTATASSRITFPRDKGACLVLTSWLGISLQSHEGWETIRTAVGMLVFAECKGLWAMPARK